MNSLKRTRISYLDKTTSTSNVVISQQHDLADQITKLANLREKGILTDEEFQTQKNKFLSL